MNKIIIGIIVIVVLGFIVGIAMQDTNKNADIASVIEIDKIMYDFGDIDIFDGKVQTEYILTNTGTKDVQIISAETSCMCTEGKIDDFVFGMHGSSGEKTIIPVGASKTLIAIYDPLAHGPNGTGQIRRDLFIKTNSSATPEIKVQFTANVVKRESEPASVGGE